VGDTAPDIELRGTHDGEQSTYRLSDFTDNGKWVFLMFYTFDFNPICTEGMCAIRDAEFFDLYEELVPLGVSGDGIHAHEQFAGQYGINYPLLSHTGRCRRTVRRRSRGVRRDAPGPPRGVFVVNDTRTVRFSTVIETESPDDIDLGPINDVRQELLG